MKAVVEERFPLLVPSTSPFDRLRTALRASFDCAAPFDFALRQAQDSAQDKLRQGFDELSPTAQSGSGLDSPFDFAQGMAQPMAQTTWAAYFRPPFVEWLRCPNGA